MHIKIRHFIAAALLIGAAYGGYRYEATRIQQSCDDPHAVTRLNDQAYVCLPGPVWNALVEKLKSRGA